MAELRLVHDVERHRRAVNESVAVGCGFRLYGDLAAVALRATAA